MASFEELFKVQSPMMASESRYWKVFPQKSSPRPFYLRSMFPSNQERNTSATKMPDLEEDIHIELATGILKSTLTTLLWRKEITSDAGKNYQKIAKELAEEIKGLQEESSHQLEQNKTLKQYITAQSMFERTRQKHTIFTRYNVHMMATHERSFSFGETSEERSAREKSVQQSLKNVSEEWAEVQSSKSSTRKQRKDALENAKRRRSRILKKKEFGDWHATTLLSREGLSKELWGEDLHEMMNRQIVEMGG